MANNHSITVQQEITLILKNLSVNLMFILDTILNFEIWLIYSMQLGMWPEINTTERKQA